MTITDPIKTTNTRAGVRLAGYKRSADAVTPIAGVDGLRTMLPVSEPTSVGEPPISPSRVTRAAPAWPVRRVPLACGLVATSPGDADPRVDFTLEWAGLGADERAALAAFLSGECGEGLRSMTVYPDGRMGSSINVRALGPATFIAEGGSDTRGIAAGAVGVFGCTLRAEEVA